MSKFLEIKIPESRLISYVSFSCAIIMKKGLNIRKTGSISINQLHRENSLLDFVIGRCWIASHLLNICVARRQGLLGAG